MQQAEAERTAAADKILKVETGLQDARKALKQHNEDHGCVREQLVRLESRLENVAERQNDIREKIREKFACPPEGLVHIAGPVLEKMQAQLPLEEDSPSSPLHPPSPLQEQGEHQQTNPQPSDQVSGQGASASHISGDNLASQDNLEALEDRLEKARNALARLGNVNQLAEQELATLEGEYQSLNAEREDLLAAVERLRESIGELNREGRRRLLQAFREVDAHFQQLYTTLFHGGAASLKLLETDDPLETGLEIYARPPGKKTQVLTLLSGGEQALTALALVFAVFLSNPSPVCVLDEVDAPLDDANVERFCNLMDRMKADTQTRFLVITHHPLTMARMDRLFGVTMMEQGISSLVSVDLETAEQMRETG